MHQRTIGVVGPCAAGKSTLVGSLRAAGVDVRHIAQEHSYVKDMWKRIVDPDFLVYLDVSYPITIQRRILNWTYAEYCEQLARLEHARQHANLVVMTDALTPSEVLVKVLSAINE